VEIVTCLFFLLLFLSPTVPQEMSTGWLMNFSRGTIENFLLGGVTGYGNTTAQERKAIQRVVKAAEKIIGCALPSIEEIFRSRC